MRIRWIGALQCIWLSVVLGVAQTLSSAGPSMQGQAVFSKADDDHLAVSTISVRPMVKVLMALSREYGWVTDYEESKDPVLPLEQGASPERYRAGQFDAVLPAPASGTDEEIRSLLLSMTDQFDSAGLQHFTVQSPAQGRFDITSAAPGETPLLDTPILLPSIPRTIESTVDVIIALVSAKRGVRIERGGIVDAELGRTFVLVGNEAPLAARVLLAKALDGASNKRIWLLEYEPGDNEYYLGIQWAAAIQHTFSGESFAWAIPRQSAN